MSLTLIWSLTLTTTTTTTNQKIKQNWPPSYPFCDPLPNNQFGVISDGTTVRLRQLSHMHRRANSMDHVELLHALISISSFSTLSKGPLFPKVSSARKASSSDLRHQKH